MSIALRAVAIDLTAYRAIQGSGNLDLVERVAAQSATQLAAEDAWFLQLRPDHLPLLTAIEDIVNGRLRDGRSAALSYGVAADILAEHLGDRIDDEELAELSSAVPAEIDRVISEVRSAHAASAEDWPLLADVLVRGPALQIPWQPEALPNGTGTITEAEVCRAAEFVRRIEPAEEEDEVRNLASIYASWLIRASHASRALLLTCD